MFKVGDRVRLPTKELLDAALADIWTGKTICGKRPSPFEPESGGLPRAYHGLTVT